MMMPHLTPLEARVVDMILGRRDFDETTSLKTIADDAGVSEAMIVKIAKKLGFAGFKDFRTGIVDYNRLPTADLHQELSPDDTGAEIAQKVFRTSIHALEETLSILDPEAFERAADLIFHARQRDFYGIGGSAQIARDVAHKFLRIGVRTSVFDDAHMMLMSAALLGEGDVAIGFSHSGTTTAVIEPLELARRRGARTIALTNYATSPLAAIADVVLCSTAQGSPLLGENAAARIAQLDHLRRRLRRRRAARPRGGRTQPRRDDERRRRQAAHHMTRRAAPSSWWSAASTTTSWSMRPTGRARARPSPASPGGRNSAARAATRPSRRRRPAPRSAWPGAVGDDDFGRFLLEQLAAGGVDAARIARLDRHGSGHERRDHRMPAATTAPSSCRVRTCSIDPAAFDDAGLWRDAGILVLQNEMPEAINLVGRACGEAGRARRSASTPRPSGRSGREFGGADRRPGRQRDRGRAIVRHRRSTILPPRTRRRRCLADRFPAVVVTAGGDGVVGMKRGEAPVVQPAIPVTLVSTHGAGDVFVGTFATAMAKRFDFANCLRRANEAAAAHVSRRSRRRRKKL